MDKKYFWSFYLKPSDKFEWVYLSILLLGLVIMAVGFFYLYHKVYIPKLEKKQQEEKTFTREDILQRQLSP